MSSPSLELTPEAIAYRQAQEAEYSAWVATEKIYVDGALAFDVGHPVPKSHVTNGVVDKSQVAKPDTKAGQEAVAANTPSKGEPA